MTIRFDTRVAIVTGAGGGMGRTHALALASRGAKVLVNDLGGMRDGTGGSPMAAQAVADEIRAAGGEALANGASVTDYAEFFHLPQQSPSTLNLNSTPSSNCREQSSHFTHHHPSMQHPILDYVAVVGFVHGDPVVPDQHIACLPHMPIKR